MNIEEPWLDEPDEDRFYVDGQTYLCLAARVPEWGHWCGYVGVGRNHPAYGRPASELEDVVCHGGLTFSGHINDFTGWFFGFDCGHAFDYSPYRVRYMREIGAPSGMIESLEQLEANQRDGPLASVYRDLDFVRLNCIAIIAQLKALADGEDVDDPQ